MLYELTCVECNMVFDSAASLLKHFAQHASEVIPGQTRSNENQNSTNQKPNMPDLFPISSFTKLKDLNVQSENTEEEISFSITKSLVSSLRACHLNLDSLTASSLSEYDNEVNSEMQPRILKDKYLYCDKTLNSSPDLIEHTLTHNGGLSTSDTSFFNGCYMGNGSVKANGTIYNNSTPGKKIKLPQLTPIGLIMKRKSRKQDKEKIKRQVLNFQRVYEICDSSKVTDRT